MKPLSTLALCALASSMTTGCIARAAFDAATLPVRTASKTVGLASDVVDLATTSDSERDQKRGREIRRREERLGKLDREYREQLDDCDDGKRKACRKARETYAEMRALMPTVPYEPEDD